MIIVSDCLSRNDDEGYVKISKNIATRLKRSVGNRLRIIAINDEYAEADVNINVNKFFLSIKLMREIKSKEVLYMSPGSNSLGTALKIFMLSIFANSLTTVFVQSATMRMLPRIFLKLSRVKIVCMSKVMYDFYLGELRRSVYYVPIGINFDEFQIADKETKKGLREKYNIPLGAKVILHVGHLKKGRNIQKLFKLPEHYLKLLVISSSTIHETEILEIIKGRKDIRIIDKYIDNIAEVYQMSDLYFFPVIDPNYCIGIPLSVIEAAACGIPVLTTKFGDLKYLPETEGIKFLDEERIDECDCNVLDSLINSVQGEKNRDNVKQYDWDTSIKILEKIIYE